MDTLTTPMISTNELRKLIEGRKEFGSVESLCIDLCGGSVDGGRMMYRLFMWWQKTKNADGWVYKSHVDWYTELRIKRSQLVKAKAALLTAGVEVQRLKGKLSSPILHYRLNAEAFMTAVANLLKIDIETVKKICSPFTQSVVANSSNGLPENRTIECVKIEQSSTVLTTDSSSLYKQEETTTNTARAQSADVDVSEIASTGEHFLQSTEGADSTSTFEATRHTSDAPENNPPVPTPPLPKLVAVLVDKHKLSPLTAAEYVAKHGVEYCERVASIAIKGHTPAGLWVDRLNKGDYKHVVSDKPRVAGKIDEFIIK